MSPNTEQLILAELSEIRKAQSGHGEQIASIKKHVELYLGNGNPGYVPEELKKLSEVLGQHETYIQQQTGSDAGKTKAKTDILTRRMAIVSLIATLGVLVGIIYNIAHMAR